MSGKGMKHIESLDKCYVACKETYNFVRQSQMVAIKNIIIKHSSTFQKIGATKIVVAYMNKDLISVFKAINDLLKQKEMKPLLIQILKDFQVVYKENDKHINELIQCYLKNCDKEAIEITKQCIEMCMNVGSLISDKAVQKEIKVIQTQVAKQMSKAHKMLLTSS